MFLLALTKGTAWYFLAKIISPTFVKSKETQRKITYIAFLYGFTSFYTITKRRLK